MPTGELFSGGAGLLGGLALSALLYPALSGLSGAWMMIPVALTVFFGYAGMRIGLNKREELAERIAALY